MENRKIVGGYQWLSIIFLIAGPLLQYIEQWISPGVDGNTLAEMLRGIAQNSDAYLVTSVVGFFGGLVYIPLYLVLFHLTKDRSPILSHIALFTGFFGAIGSATMHVIQIFLQQMVQTNLDFNQMAKISNQIENGPLAQMILPMFLIGMFGTMLIMIIAMWKSKKVPRIPLLLILLFMVPDFLNLKFVPHQGFFNIHILLLVAFCWIAYSVTKISKKDWVHPPVRKQAWL